MAIDSILTIASDSGNNHVYNTATIQTDTVHAASVVNRSNNNNNNNNNNKKRLLLLAAPNGGVAASGVQDEDYPPPLLANPQTQNQQRSAQDSVEDEEDGLVQNMRELVVGDEEDDGVDIETDIEEHESDEQVIRRLNKWAFLWCPQNSSTTEEECDGDTEMATFKRIHRRFGARDEGENVVNETMEHRYLSIMSRFATLLQVLTRRNLADNDPQPLGDDPDVAVAGHEGEAEDEFGNSAEQKRKRFATLLKINENLWYASQMLVLLGHVRLINNTRALGMIPEHLLTVRYSPPDLGNCNKYQRLLMFYMQKCRERRLQKYCTSLYEPRVTKSKLRKSVRLVCEIEDFVWNAVHPRLHNQEMWDCLTEKPGNAKAAANYIEKCCEHDIPFLKRNKKFMGFLDGDYDLGTDTWYDIDGPGYDSTESTGNFFPVKFNNDLWERILTTCSYEKCPAFIHRQKLAAAATVASAAEPVTSDFASQAAHLNQETKETKHDEDDAAADMPALVANRAPCMPREQEEGQGSNMDTRGEEDKVKINAKEGEGAAAAAAVNPALDEEIECMCENDYMKIPTPAIQSIFDHQKLPEDVCRWIYAMMGRLFFDVNERDNWQIQMFLTGLAQTGKSCLLKLAEYMFDKNDVGYFNNSVEVKFPLQGIYTKHIYLAMDIHQGFNLDQFLWQSMVAGEGVVVTRKNLPPLMIVWKIQGIFAGNDTIDWDDNGGSVSRRFFNVPFLWRVVNGDPHLFSKMKAEIAAFIKKCILAYAGMVRLYSGVDIWSVLPDLLQSTKLKIKEERHALEAFVRSTKMVTGHGYLMPLSLFKDVFREFCIQENHQVKRLTQNYSGLVFQTHGLEVRHANVEEYGGVPLTNQEFIYGIDTRAHRDEIDALKAEAQAFEPNEQPLQI